MALQSISKAWLLFAAILFIGSGESSHTDARTLAASQHIPTTSKAGVIPGFRTDVQQLVAAFLQPTVKEFCNKLSAVSLELKSQISTGLLDKKYPDKVFDDYLTDKSVSFIFQYFVPYRYHLTRTHNREHLSMDDLPHLWTTTNAVLSSGFLKNSEDKKLVEAFKEYSGTKIAEVLLANAPISQIGKIYDRGEDHYAAHMRFYPNRDRQAPQPFNTLLSPYMIHSNERTLYNARGFLSALTSPENKKMNEFRYFGNLEKVRQTLVSWLEQRILARRLQSVFSNPRYAEPLLKVYRSSNPAQQWTEQFSKFTAAQKKDLSIADPTHIHTDEKKAQYFFALAYDFYNAESFGCNKVCMDNRFAMLKWLRKELLLEPNMKKALRRVYNGGDPAQNMKKLTLENPQIDPLALSVFDPKRLGSARSFDIMQISENYDQQNDKTRQRMSNWMRQTAFSKYNNLCVGANLPLFTLKNVAAEDRWKAIEAWKTALNDKEWMATCTGACNENRVKCLSHLNMRSDARNWLKRRQTV